MSRRRVRAFSKSFFGSSFALVLALAPVLPSRASAESIALPPTELSPPPARDDPSHSSGPGSSDSVSQAPAKGQDSTPVVDETNNEQDGPVQNENIEPSEQPDFGGNGIAGRITPANDPANQQATEELEGAPLDRSDSSGNSALPQRFSRVAAIGWWTLFAGVALGTAGGTFASAAESKTEAASRIANRLDPETGTRVAYSDVQDEYDKVLRQGRAYEQTGRVLLIAGAVGLITGVVILSVHGRRDPAREKMSRQTRSPRLRFTASGAELQF